MATNHRLVVQTDVTVGDNKLASRVKGVKFTFKHGDVIVSEDDAVMTLHEQKKQQQQKQNKGFNISNVSQNGKSIVTVNGKIHMSNSSGSSVVIRNGETFINGVKVVDHDGDSDDNDDMYFGYKFYDLYGLKFGTVIVEGNSKFNVVDTVNLCDNVKIVTHDTSCVEFLHFLDIHELTIDAYDNSNFNGHYSDIGTLLITNHGGGKVDRFTVHDSAKMVSTTKGSIGAHKHDDKVHVSVEGDNVFVY